MPILNKCCCCVDLRTGGIILGSLSLIGSVLMLILSSMGLYATYHRFHENMTLEELLQQASQEQDASSLTMVRVVFWITIILCVAMAVVSVLMIVGSQKVRRRRRTMPL